MPPDLPSSKDAIASTTCLLCDELHDLFEEAPIPYVHEAMDSRFIRVNRAARTLLGLCAADVEAGRGITLQAATPESRQRLDRAFDSVRRGRAVTGVLLQLPRHDGPHPLWVEWSSTPALDRNFTRTMLIDVTERVRRQAVADRAERRRHKQALAASEQLARGQIEALGRTLTALAMATEPDRLLEHVLGTITAQLGAHSSSVWRMDESGKRLLFHSSYEAGSFITRADLSMDEDKLSLSLDASWPWPEAVHTGRPVIVADIRALPEFPWQKRLVALGVITILATPMRIGGRVDGLIGIRFTSARRFKPEEIALAVALTNQATLSLHLMRLSLQSREAAVTAERNRMARDIHDTLAQGLTGVIVQLEAAADAQQRGLQPEADGHLARAQGLARESLTEARRSVRALRPKELDDKALGEALEALIRKMTAGTAVSAAFAVHGLPMKLPTEWEDNLLRAVQEVLTNVLRHARASDFEARLLFRPDEIRLELRDNGCGFDPGRKSDGFGLIGVRERVQAMRGHMSLVSAEGHGTQFCIALPLTAHDGREGRP